MPHFHRDPKRDANFDNHPCIHIYIYRYMHVYMYIYIYIYMNICNLDFVVVKAGFLNTFFRVLFVFFLSFASVIYLRIARWPQLIL